MSAVNTQISFPCDDPTWVVVVDLLMRPRKCVKEYLVSIAYQTYSEGRSESIMTTLGKSDAFRFRTLAAAEMAAVYVGGRVRDWAECPEELEHE